MKEKILSANPYMPLWEHVPDGEPRVFEFNGEKRVYVYGSHDTLKTAYCGTDQVVWSAPVDDLTNWYCHGVCYTATDGSVLYAPDVVQKGDTFYLYAATPPCPPGCTEAARRWSGSRRRTWPPSPRWRLQSAANRAPRSPHLPPGYPLSKKLPLLKTDFFALGFRKILLFLFPEKGKPGTEKAVFKGEKHREEVTR